MSKSRFTSVPYGYTLNGDALAADKDRAAVILEIFQSKASGMSLQQIADALNNKGVKTIRGGDFTKQGIKYILGNRAYIGEYSHNGGIEIYKIPELVSEQLFNEVNGVKTLGIQEGEYGFFYPEFPFSWM
jgi:hypothetical protein